MNLLKYTRIFSRWCTRMFKRENLGTSLDKWLYGPREEWHEVLRGNMFHVQECKSVNVPECSPVHHESWWDVTGQILNCFLDRNVTLKRERSVIRFQRRSTGAQEVMYSIYNRNQEWNIWRCGVAGNKEVCKR